MNQTKKLLVALDLTDFDKQLVQYTASLAKHVDLEKVYFIHNIKKYEFSDLFQDQIKDIALDELVKKKIEKLVYEEFDSSVETDVLISDDPYTESLIQYTVNKFAIDLVVLGNKNLENGSGILNYKLLHKLPCDLLSVPKNTSFQQENFLTTTDFSLQSRRGIRKAIAMRNDDTTIDCLHVYQLPSIYFPYIDKEEAKEKLGVHSEKKMNKFLKKHDFSDEVTPHLEVAGKLNIVENIRKTASNLDSDVIFISSKGKNNFNNLLSGSVTEYLFTNELQQPLWIVR